MKDAEIPKGHKSCSECKIVKLFSEFGKEAKGKFGLKSKCKQCISDKNKSYSAGNGAAVKRKNNEAYQAEHKDELAEKMRIVRAKKKYGDRYSEYVESLAKLKQMKN